MAKNKTGPGTLADRIRKAREDKGWSQAELARRMNIQRSAVNQWERGTSGPKRENWPLLSSLLGWPQLGMTGNQTSGEQERKASASSASEEPMSREVQWGNIMQELLDRSGIDAALARGETPSDITFDTFVPDDAMLPMTDGKGGFVPGDRIVVSQTRQPQDGSIVVAQIEGQEPILREYRQRGSAIDLIATNGEYPTESITSRRPGRIGGVVVEHVRTLV